ncbi:hypothetical protein O1L44_15675 [Streptomyces noursei]|nr:hypothetical protein [Streptomyces noursei]
MSAAATDPTGTAQTELHQVLQRAYTYRADGHLTAIDDSHTGRRTFDLDRAGRVTAVHATDWTETYAYDAAGNQTNATWPDRHPNPSARGTRTYEGTRITRAGRIRYEHDVLGRVTLRQKSRVSRKPDTWRYAWNSEDRLTSVTTPDGTTWRYLYDPLARRVAKQRLTCDSVTIAEQIDFAWDGTTVAEETTTSPRSPYPITLTWDHDGLRPIAQTERKSLAQAPQQDIDQRFFAIVTDLVGTPTDLVDEVGTSAWRTQNTVWGATAWTRSSIAYTPLRFPGQYFDPESGLHYNCHRYYAPESGRYASVDPLGLAPASNPVSYVHNPHTWFDQLGLAPEGCGRPFPVYRTPKAADAAYERLHGPNPANHQPGVDLGGGYLSEGTIYFGERSVAAEYINPAGRHYANGMVRYDMHREDFLKEFGGHAERYDRKGPNGSPRIEFVIPVDKLGRFNELTIERTWVPFGEEG